MREGRWLRKFAVALMIGPQAACVHGTSGIDDGLAAAILATSRAAPGAMLAPARQLPQRVLAARPIPHQIRIAHGKPMPIRIERWTMPLTMLGVIALLAWTSISQAAPATSRPAVAITGVTIVDVEHEQLTGPRTVLIEDGRIVAIGNSYDVAIPASAQHLDGRGRFLMPGLVDMHVHLFNLSSHRPPNDWSFPLYVANGVLGIRDMRADAASVALVKHWNKLSADGELVAPRILATGIPVHGSSPDDATRQVDAAVDAGADFIKVFSEVSTADWRAIIAEAKRRSLPVVGHVPAGVPLLTAAEAGQRSDEHLMQAYEACSSIESTLLAERDGLDGDALIERSEAQEARTLAAFNPDKCRDVSQRLAATGQVQVPTLVLADEDTLASRSHPDSDARWRYLRPDERVRWQGFLTGYTANDAALAKQRWPIARQIVASMQRAGVTIMPGTDAPMPGVYPGFSLLEELQLLVDAGLTPFEVLRAATLEPAKFLGSANVAGSVTVGKRADLVLLDADPSKDIGNTRRIRAVLLDGRVLQRADLDALLERAARMQAPPSQTPDKPH